jgi:hypothetical protein
MERAPGPCLTTAWIAFELDSATGFPKGNIIAQKLKPGEARALLAGALPTLSDTLHTVTPNDSIRGTGPFLSVPIFVSTRDFVPATLPNV